MVYLVNNKIEVINENFFNLKNIKTDLVFLNPDYEFPKKDHKFSIFKNIKPDLSKILKKALSISKNIVMLLPKFVKIEELA